MPDLHLKGLPSLLEDTLEDPQVCDWMLGKVTSGRVLLRYRRQHSSVFLQWLAVCISLEGHMSVKQKIISTHARLLGLYLHDCSAGLFSSICARFGKPNPHSFSRSVSPSLASELENRTNYVINY